MLPLTLTGLPGGVALLLALTVLGGVNPEDQFHRPCMARDFGRGSVVCVCNSSYCDSAPSLLTPATASGPRSWDEEVKRGRVQIYTSSKTGQRLHKSSRHFNDGREEGNGGLTTTPEQSTPLLDFTIYGNELDSRRRRRARQPHSRSRRFLQILKSDFPRPNQISKLTLSRRRRYQEILGIGGSFTDAAGLNIRSLSYGAQENLMKSYFGEEGNDYSLGRVPIGGTDFSSRPYTYDDVPFPDANLTHFSLQPEDYTLKMPYIEWAQRLSGGKLRLVASPWSAPVWMKTNNRLNGAGVLRKEYYQVWADYFLRFIQSYEEHGIPIWAVTTGNEPFNGFIPKFPFNCMGWTAADAGKWIANNLGPTLRSTQPDVKIIMMDDNKAVVPTWAKEILENSEASQYVSGVGTHWYFDFLTSLDVLSRFHAKYPDYFIVQTEACLGFTPWELEKVILGSWERAEMYLGAIINDMRNWVGGWIDWNLALDLRGGPNWAKWAADAAILVNPKTDEFFKQPIHYGIGHVSKFVPPGSVRIEMSGERLPRNLQSVAFLRPDNGTVIVFLNKLSYDAKVSLYDEDRGSLFLRIPAKSIQTLVYW